METELACFVGTGGYYSPTLRIAANYYRLAIEGRIEYPLDGNKECIQIQVKYCSHRG
jgi:hypothetical protein